MPNFAPEPWNSQGYVLDAYAALHGVPRVELSRLLNEEYLVELGSAFPEDVAFPAKPSNGTTTGSGRTAGLAGSWRLEPTGAASSPTT